jgi:hypothetical protein
MLMTIFITPVKMIISQGPVWRALPHLFVEHQREIFSLVLFHDSTLYGPLSQTLIFFRFGSNRQMFKSENCSPGPHLEGSQILRKFIQWGLVPRGNFKGV